MLQIPYRLLFPVSKPSLHARALFAARLVQARQLRGLSQRALGDLMGLGKEKGSSRINRYEHQVTAIGFDNLERLAEILQVPVAYLLAETPEMADAILVLSRLPQIQQATLTSMLSSLTMHSEPSDELRQLVQKWLDGHR